MAAKRPPISLHEAASRLGVHYMTAYRYIRTGRLPAVKVGAEWRIDPAEVERFAVPDAAPPRRRRGSTDYPARLASRLVVGDEAGAWTVVEDAMTAGVEPGDVYLRLFAPAMEQIGDGWEAGRLSVADEHQASAVMLRLIGRLGPRLRRRGRTRGSVVLGAPPGDAHGVPVALLADLLRNRGFRVCDLGADVPAGSFAESAGLAERLIGVAIGATTSGNDEQIMAAVEALREVVDVPIVVGGAGIRDLDHAAALGADAFAPKAPEAIEVFESLARSGALPDGASTR